MIKKYKNIATIFIVISSFTESKAQVIFSAPAISSRSDSTQIPKKGFNVYYGFDKPKEHQTIASPAMEVDSSKQYEKMLLDSIAIVRNQLKKLKAPQQRKKRAENSFSYIPSIYPVKKGYISSAFGWRKHPVSGETKLHTGIDFALPEGNGVYATADGIVEKVVLDPDGIGLAVYIIHPSGYTSVYGHMSGYEVVPGMKVYRGNQIGRVGSTGNSTGCHLHYSVLYKGKAVDPYPFCELLAKTM